MNIIMQFRINLLILIKKNMHKMKLLKNYNNNMKY